MRILHSAIFTFAALLGSLAVAGQPSILVPADVKLSANVDVQRMKANPLGQQLIGGFLQSVTIDRSGTKVSVSVEITQDMVAEQLSAAMGN
ncbi:hypothetical protein Enr13x_60330 [Stieleria neptunia]|uniref:Uncharacterized protein n=1 Tax=Stieleria neptunia TaxID=2527979 RepID=A0A518HZ62_9BACT|nr:hypothetical protein [Stieleria neptunia]QDV46129.1 hypothetical protein Enr13x_60330 [Stieleria neptunia]